MYLTFRRASRESLQPRRLLIVVVVGLQQTSRPYPDHRVKLMLDPER